MFGDSNRRRLGIGWTIVAAVAMVSMRGPGVQAEEFRPEPTAGDSLQLVELSRHPLEVPSQLIALDGNPREVWADPGGDIIYLNRSEAIDVFSLGSVQVVDSQRFEGFTHSAPLADGSIALFAGRDPGGYRVWNRQDGSIEERSLPDWITRINAVAEVSPGLLFIAAEPDFDPEMAPSPWMFFDVDTEEVTHIDVPQLRGVLDERLLVVPGEAVFATITRVNRQVFVRIDVPSGGVQSAELEGGHYGDQIETGPITLTADGDWLYTHSGIRFNATTLRQSGSVEPGFPVLSADEDVLYQVNKGRGFALITGYDTGSLADIGELRATCPLGWDHNVEVNHALAPDPGRLLLFIRDDICVVDLDAGTMPDPILPPGGRFFDDDESIHEAAIEGLAMAGITAGCNPTQNTAFCPDRPITRGEMATFLTRVLSLSPSGSGHFEDVDESAHRDAIYSVAAAGITRGCNPPDNTRFCPDAAVTRGEMAAFLGRSLGLPAASSAGFTDTGSSVFRSDIDRLAASEITRGCNPPGNDMFCPERPVTRAEMATFLTRGFEIPPIPVEPREFGPVGEDLEVYQRARSCIDNGNTRCELNSTIYVGPFYFVLGWMAENWSQLHPDDQERFRSDDIRVEATFNDHPLDLVESGFLLNPATDMAEKVYGYQFPYWMGKGHRLVVSMIDDSHDYRVDIVVVIDAGLGGYPEPITPD